MTRTSLAATLRRVYIVLGVVLVVSLVARMADQIPGIAGSPAQKVFASIYDWLKDMALVLVTVVAAYLANVFQKRSKFVGALEREWRGIVKTKNALYVYCEKSYPTADDYLAAFSRISATIDNMRIVYRNVGETGALVGLYPYAPLHDMRRALQTIDPRKSKSITPEQQRLVREAILQAFYALRENFLEELDLEQPTHALLVSRARRLKAPGAAEWARRDQERQHDAMRRQSPTSPDVDLFLAELYEREQMSERNGAARNGRAAATANAPQQG
ncbi:MAG: hypothetical protein R3D27_06635 [Hyphomicrobiaceae bacterium]